MSYEQRLLVMLHAKFVSELYMAGWGAREKGNRGVLLYRQIVGGQSSSLPCRELIIIEFICLCVSLESGTLWLMGCVAKF